MTLRSAILLSTIFLLSLNRAQAQKESLKDLLEKKRLVVIMFDGFGMSYYKNAPMPFLKNTMARDFFKDVSALMPTVTNANNASICCGTFINENGITGNSFLDEHDEEEYMESKDLLTAPTLFEKLQKLGLKSALLASKKKSVALLSKGTDIALSPETADSSWIRRIGQPPSIYSPDVNYWTMKASLDILKNRQDIRCLYIHTTDYPMHMWAPEDTNCVNHLKMIDYYLSEIARVAPDAMILMTADHDVNHKDRCVDLETSLKKKGIDIKIAISAERDKYMKHHRGFGGTSFVYLKDKADEAKVKKGLLEIKGVKTVLTNAEAVKKYRLVSSRIGDLFVLSDSISVFGNLENKENEDLPANYRTHGSEYELRVPLFIYNAKGLPSKDYFQYNKDLTAWLFEKK